MIRMSGGSRENYENELGVGALCEVNNAKVAAPQCSSKASTFKTSSLKTSSSTLSVFMSSSFVIFKIKLKSAPFKIPKTYKTK